MTFANLQGLTALVTGGSRGIGKATAHMLKAQGAEVIILGSTLETVEKASTELQVKGLAVDLFQPESIAKIEASLPQVAPNGIDILVNNAGITRDGLFLRQTEDAWNQVLTINLQRVVELTRVVLPTMTKKEFGRIINLSSIVSHMGNIGQTNYITSKAAISGFTKALAKEVARKGVTVNSVAPGFIGTDMTASIPEQVKEKFIQQIPANRFGEPAEIAAAITFLASREAAYITGTTLHVNGGMYVGS